MNQSSPYTTPQSSPQALPSQHPIPDQAVEITTPALIHLINIAKWAKIGVISLVLCAIFAITLWFRISQGPIKLNLLAYFALIMSVLGPLLFGIVIYFFSKSIKTYTTTKTDQSFGKFVKKQAESYTGIVILCIVCLIASVIGVVAINASIKSTQEELDRKRMDEIHKRMRSHRSYNRF